MNIAVPPKDRKHDITFYFQTYVFFNISFIDMAFTIEDRKERHNTDNITERAYLFQLQTVYIAVTFGENNSYLTTYPYHHLFFE